MPLETNAPVVPKRSGQLPVKPVPIYNQAMAGGNYGKGAVDMANMELNQSNLQKDINNKDAVSQIMKTQEGDSMNMLEQSQESKAVDKKFMDLPKTSKEAANKKVDKDAIKRRLKKEGNYDVSTFAGK